MTFQHLTEDVGGMLVEIGILVLYPVVDDTPRNLFVIVVVGQNLPTVLIDT